ncbi:hypothetical protein LGK95_13500 [Clostridium algoriphilum]|uniref:hypothetical protein n=1 Tax=Clostridium algoriphilum TaxID=198347 RepID=UPI001CF2001D|nr:hypothetical protein [Clostridium algoriphilum]MCB2294524.1 hypothetical protein [Clostridium algoriphilum]
MEIKIDVLNCNGKIESVFKEYMFGMEIFKMLNLILGASIILLCLLIFVIAGVISYYLKYREVELYTAT